jgi:alpha-glucosidase
MGAAGFRTDVAHGLSKHPDYADLADDATGGDHPYWDRDDVHTVIRRWRRVIDSYPDDRMMVAEAWPDTLDRHVLYQRPDEFHQAFNFFLLMSEWDLESMRSIIEDSLRGSSSVGSLPTWVLSNHDVIRPVTRLGLAPGVDAEAWLLKGDPQFLDEAAGRRRARAASLLVLALPGSAYIYQGEELGLPEVVDLPIEVLDDPIWERSGHTAKGRDGCRVPVPWTRQGDSFGFGGDPWLPMPADWGELSVEAQKEDAESTFEMFRTALRARREFSSREAFEWLEVEDALAFRRGDVISITNYGSNPIALPAGDIIVANGEISSGRLPPETTAWVSG